MSNRKATVTRKTKETDISLNFSLDGNGGGEIVTGIGFFNHMLDSFARHGLFDLDVAVVGDLHVDDHHTVEDVGIVLGQAIAQGIGDKAGIKRFGSVILPMDETLMLCALDLSGRPYYKSDVVFNSEFVGEMKTEMIKEFFYAVATNSGMNLHFKILDGENSHHIVEAMFKSFGKALDIATQKEDRIKDAWSTKGGLA